MGRLYAIVDLPDPYGLAVDDVVSALLRGAAGDGLYLLQLRAKAESTRGRVELLQRAGPLCAAARVPLVVNDDVDAALAGVEGVRGVHLGQTDDGAQDLTGLRERAATLGQKDFLVGLSTHDPRQLRTACHRAPDYVAYGPVLPTRSKQRPEPAVGLSGLLEACRHAWRPIVAIGGLDEHTGAEAMRVGATAVAVIAGLRAETPAAVQHRASRLCRALSAAARPLELAEVAREIPVLSIQQLEELAQWASDLGTHITFGLPARFRPLVTDAGVRYRPSDVCDLLHVLGKVPEESWEDWATRGAPSPLSPLVQLRRSDPGAR